jgi:hypothetical protein
MRGRKTALRVLLTDDEQRELESIIRTTTLPVGLVQRAKAVLCVSRGMPLTHTAQTVALSEPKVRKWVTRFQKQRITGLKDKEGRGRKPLFSPRSGNLCGQDSL